MVQCVKIEKASNNIISTHKFEINEKFFLKSKLSSYEDNILFNDRVERVNRALRILKVFMNPLCIF